MTNESTTRVWVEDRNPILRMGLAACVEAAGLTVAGESSGFVPSPPTYRIDVLLVDLAPDRLGWLANFTASNSTRLLATVEEAEPRLVAEALQRGSHGVLVRDMITAESLVLAIAAAMSGRACLPTTMLPDVIDSAQEFPRHRCQRLTNRELDVLRLVSEGQNLRRIADTLSYSEKTIKNVIHDVVVRTGCRNRAEAVALATKEGLI